MSPPLGVHVDPDRSKIVSVLHERLVGRNWSSWKDQPNLIQQIEENTKLALFINKPPLPDDDDFIILVISAQVSLLHTCITIHLPVQHPGILISYE